MKTQQLNIIRRPAVRIRTGLSDSHRERLERRGQFPAKVRISEMAVGWLEHEIDEWVKSRPRANGRQPPLPKSRRPAPLNKTPANVTPQ